MTIRDRRQIEFADEWIEKGQWGILLLAPRFGKIRTSIHIFNKLQPKSILIAYPDNKIKKSWQTDFKIMNYDDSNVAYTTFLSLHKYKEKQFDIVVIDEIHLLSENQIKAASELINNGNLRVLGLTGTLSQWTERVIREDLNLRVIARYSIKQAIDEGVITDYEIQVITVPLDSKKLIKYNTKWRTEKRRFDSLSWIINNLEQEMKDSTFMRLARMRIIQNSVAKQQMTKDLLSLYKDERVLVFCGVTKIADGLGIPSYHSKSSEKEVFDDFAVGKGNHLAVVKIGNTGVTYKPLNRVIINYTDSNPEGLTQKINRCMSLEYGNPGKKALITIVSTNEPVELNWVKKALNFFDKTKINYV